jgi:NADPH:quinone reductase-like Zn-dependent oxidoreductase
MTMRAIAVDTLKGKPQLMILPRPTPKPDQLLVKVSVAGMNPFDWQLTDGVMKEVMPNVLPFVMGIDAAGDVVDLGSQVSRFCLGDRVFGQFFHSPLGEGTYAEYCVVPETATVAKLPPSVPDKAAAALPTAAMTALSMIDSLEIDPGSTVLIVGATGGVGAFATQLAAGRGFIVLVTAGPQDAERMQGLGASQVFDARGTELIAQLTPTYRQRIHAVIDLVSDRATFKSMARFVLEGGYMLTTVDAADPEFLKDQHIKGGNFSLEADAGLLLRLASLVETGQLVVPIEATISLEQAPDAIAASRNGHARGKTVIRM